MAAVESEACQTLAAEVRSLLRGADQQWRTLEAKLIEAEEATLRDHAEALQTWFGADVSSNLSNWADAGLRRKIRDRVHKLLLAPLDERIWHQVALSEIQLSAAGADLIHPIDMLLEHWEASVEPVLGKATKEDNRIAKKLKRLQAVSAFHEVTKEEQKRLQIWTPVRSAVVLAEKPIRSLATLLSTDLSGEVIAKMAAAVPGIVARSICDWHFQRCVGEFEQLSAWWEGVHTSLQQRPKVWERLLEEEGVFVRRVNRGMEQINAERCRYSALATFGHSGATLGRSCVGWPAESAALLARVVHEMQRRLGPIRDSAAWRIIDSAKAIQKDINQKDKSKEGSPWEQVKQDEGVAALCQRLGIADVRDGSFQVAPKGVAAIGDIEPVDAALCFAGVLDKLVGVVTDVGNLIDEDTPDTGGVSYILEEVLQGISYVQEDLLAVLDDASEASLAAWLRDSWGEWGEARTGNQLQAAMASMPLKADSVLRPEKRQVRRSQLALMRGLHCLLADSQFRARLLELAISPVSAESGDDAKEVEKIAATSAQCRPASDVLELAELTPLSGIPAEMPPSPRSVYVSRKPEKADGEDSSPAAAGSALPVELAPSTVKHSPEQPAAPSAALSTSILKQEAAASDANLPDLLSQTKQVSTLGGTRKSPDAKGACAADLASDTITQNLPSAESPMRPRNQGIELPTTPRVPATQARPSTPSWLDPPWPRQEMPFQSWTPRPDTSSTVCDEADLAHTPKWKFVEGHCVPLRASVSGRRLAPLSPTGCPAKLTGTRKLG